MSVDTTEETTEETPIRRVRGTALKSYLWERVPRQLLDDARAKCKRQDPPVFLKFKLIELLREWTYAPEADPTQCAQCGRQLDAEHECRGGCSQ